MNTIHLPKEKKELTNIGFKRIVNRGRLLKEGYKRTFYICIVCGKRAALDSEQLPLSVPVVTPPCGHRWPEDLKQF